MKVLLFAAMLFCAFHAAAEGLVFPPELVNFEPYEYNPVFYGASSGNWDENIRERGWILKEGDVYRMWYTGYVPPQSNEKHLGYATSPDGITWTRHKSNPIYSQGWVEDMMIVKEGHTFYMFAEGAKDRAHLLTSEDGIQWNEKGTLDIRTTNGKPLSDGPFGTPAALHENGKWFLFYERNDDAIWLAASEDLKTWTNVQDDPVIKRGPEAYDRTMIALNQVVKYKGCYYAYYHAKCPENGKDNWSMNVAASNDLIHWEKYAGNPIVKPNHSSGILIEDGSSFRFYCMHPAVCLYLPKRQLEEHKKP